MTTRFLYNFVRQLRYLANCMCHCELSNVQLRKNTFLEGFCTVPPFTKLSLSATIELTYVCANGGFRLQSNLKVDLTTDDQARYP
jgi:hypothetical protein